MPPGIAPLPRAVHSPVAARAFNHRFRLTYPAPNPTLPKSSTKCALAFFIHIETSPRVNSRSRHLLIHQISENKSSPRHLNLISAISVSQKPRPPDSPFFYARVTSYSLGAKMKSENWVCPKKGNVVRRWESGRFRILRIARA
jgi:hypothetical protein